MAYQGLNGTNLAKLAIGLRTPDYQQQLPNMLKLVQDTLSGNPHYLGWAWHSYNDTSASLKVVNKMCVIGFRTWTSDVQRKSAIVSYDCQLPGQANKRFRGREAKSRRSQVLSGCARLKLDRMEAAAAVRDLSALPGNRFERLKGDRKGQCSIRINDQWRLCFEWPEGAKGPSNVEIVAYH